nr:FRG domain-containing protein [uncultured Treponema sp.]
MDTKKVITSLEDAVKEFQAINEKFLGTPRDSYAWYRGQAKDWDLLPGIMRPGLVKAFSSIEFAGRNHLVLQRYLFEKFVKLSAGLRSNECNDLVSMYFLAQHYGLQSFLLDWTIYPLVALFFAVENDSISEDGVLYAITPKMIFELYSVFEQNDSFVHSCIATLLNKPLLPEKEEEYNRILGKLQNYINQHHPTIPRPIISIIPNKTNYRIDKQGARFLLYLNGAQALTPEDCGTGMAKYYIPQQYKQKIKEQLRALFGISYGYIFGDLDSIVKEVKWMFNVHNIVDETP